MAEATLIIIGNGLLAQDYASQTSGQVRSFIIYGNTKDYKDLLLELGGKWNRFIQTTENEKGAWIFPLKKKDEVLNYLQSQFGETEEELEPSIRIPPSKPTRNVNDIPRVVIKKTTPKISIKQAAPKTVAKMTPKVTPKIAPKPSFDELKPYSKIEGNKQIVHSVTSVPELDQEVELHLASQQEGIPFVIKAITSSDGKIRDILEIVRKDNEDFKLIAKIVNGRFSALMLEEDNFLVFPSDESNED